MAIYSVPWTTYAPSNPSPLRDQQASSDDSSGDELVSEDGLYPLSNSWLRKQHDDYVARPVCSTEQHLIYLTKNFISLLNSRAFRHPFYDKHVSPALGVDYGGFNVSSLEAFLGKYRKMTDNNPEFKVLVVNESAMVDEWKGVGEVIVTKDMSAYPHLGDHRRMAGAMSFQWEREWNVWICHKAFVLTGTPTFL